MTYRIALAGAIAPVVAALAMPSAAEPVIWGIQAEQLEYRLGDSEALAWDFDAFAGTDELKFVWRSEGELSLDENIFESLENQARVQMPISDFFDAVAGIRVDSPDGPDRVYGVLGLHGLSPQWFEIDADIFVSDKPSFRFEAEYEALLTNRVTLVPSVELDLPLADDHAIGVGALGPKLEIGARLSYDLVDRAIAPFIGVHYERSFGETADLARDDGESVDAVFFVIGTRIMF